MKDYLRLSLQRMSGWLPFPPDDLYVFCKERSMYSISTDGNGYHYCLFSFPRINDRGRAAVLYETSILDHDVLLVFDEEDRIIADCAALGIPFSSFLSSEAVYEHCAEESDWLYLEHYILYGTLFPKDSYPPMFVRTTPEEGEVLLFSNAYVTKAYRRKGIFTCMMQEMRDFVLMRHTKTCTVYSVMALDPDIPCYGPDTTDEPYFYSFEKDEPDRMRNAHIVSKLGFEPLRLEETTVDLEADGTKLWFAIKKETDTIVELEEEELV